MFKQSETQPP